MALGNLFGQKYRPILFALYGGSPVPLIVPFGVPGHGIVRPEQISITRQSRGIVTHTAENAFLDDFGEGVPQLSLSGSTGWNENIVSGLLGFKAIEALFVEYLQRRKRVAANGGNPDDVKLVYIDTLNLEAFSVYPHEFSLDKTKQRPLLYLYRMNFSVLVDLLQSALYGPSGDFLSKDTLGGQFLGKLADLGTSIFQTGSGYNADLDSVAP